MATRADTLGTYPELHIKVTRFAVAPVSSPAKCRRWGQRRYSAVVTVFRNSHYDVVDSAAAGERFKMVILGPAELLRRMKL
jgi:hypothetical protein